MITRIKAQKFKLLDFDQQLGKLNLFVGPNGVGKSAVSQALTLAVLGYIPGVAKKNVDIMTAYGDGKRLTVELETDDRKHLMRRFSGGDTVSQQFMVDRKKADKTKFAVAADGIKIFDLGQFMSLSDAKKVEAIFELYPPAGDIGELDQQIDAVKTKRNRLQDMIKANEKAIESLTKQRSQIELPSGNLAELEAEIASVKKQLEDAQKMLGEAMQEDARAEALQDAAKNIPENIPRTGVNHHKPTAITEYDLDTASIVGMKLPPGCHESDMVLDSLKAVIESMKRTGCSGCAAKLVCMREMKKYKEGAA